MPTQNHQRIPSGNAGECIAVNWQPPEQTNGRSAVFVHGLASNRQGDKAMHFCQCFIQKGWGFLRFDLRGHGDSDGSVRDLTLSRCLEDLDAALKWANLSVQAQPNTGVLAPLLIGSSMGGAVACWYALKYDTQGQTPLALIAPALTFPQRYAWTLGAKAMEEWRQTGLHHFQNQWLDLEMGFDLIQDGMDYNPQELAKTLRNPALFLHGMQDSSVDWRGSMNFVEDSPNPGLNCHFIKQGDHRLTQQKELLFNLIWGWLAAHY